MPRDPSVAAFAALLTLSVAGCAPAKATLPPPAAPVAVAAPQLPRSDAARFHVLMINGGGMPDINFRPHLLHLRALRDTLTASGIHPDHISVFAGDGDDPADDLVSREVQPESDFWLLRDTRVQRPLEMPRHYESSSIADVQLHPATRASLKQWFDAEARVIEAGDTLFLYVTDHGNRGGAGPMTNTIQLWGRDQQLSVNELRDLIAGLPAGVRVVSLMSQCFSGGFAGLSIPPAPPAAPASVAKPDGGPPTFTPVTSARRNVCGYFSSTPDRPAYGCFPENAGKERVGHSFHFIRALASSRHMSDAHDATLADDDTPDVPLRSSDLFLEDVLKSAAVAESMTPEDFADKVLGSTWRDQPAWQTERALVDRISASFGLASPASLKDLEGQYDALRTLGHRLENSARAWKAAASDAAPDNLQAFIAANPSWGPRLSDTALHGLDAASARALSASLLGELAPWTHKDKGDRLDLLEHRGELSEEAAYRSEVRLAVALRVRTILMTLAGRAYLDKSGTAAQRDDFAALRSCEDVTLPGVPPAPAPAADPPASFASLPSVADDVKLEHDVHPAWLGIVFSMLREDVRKAHALPEGTSLITGVAPGSPATDAGLQPGDMVLGPPGKPFTAHNQIRAWTMLSPADQPQKIEVTRGKKHLELTVVPRAYPIDVPAPMASGPEIGAPVPAIDLHTWRGGSVKLADGKPHLLLFWATWCKPCKASLPEALAYEREHHTQIIAITDEPKATLDGFFKTWTQPFPKTVAIDDLRTTFIAFGVTATPGFVLVDGKGIVRARSMGYSRPPGLPIDGWTWDGK